MGTQETTSIAICSVGGTELEVLATAIREVGGWSIVPIQWPNAPALMAARRFANALILHSGDRPETKPCEELLGLLGGRPDATPLIVVGGDPATTAEPD